MKITITITAEEKAVFERTVNFLKKTIVNPIKDTVTNIGNMFSGETKATVDGVRAPIRERWEDAAVITTEDWSDGIQASLEIKTSYIRKVCDLVEDAAATISPSIGALTGASMMFIGACASIGEKVQQFIETHKEDNHAYSKFYTMERTLSVLDEHDTHERYLFEVNRWGSASVVAYSNYRTTKVDNATDFQTDLKVHDNLRKELEDLINGKSVKCNFVRVKEDEDTDYETRKKKIVEDLGWFTDDEIMREAFRVTYINSGHWDINNDQWVYEF